MKFNQLLLISLLLIQSTTAKFFTPVKYNSTENWSITRHIYRFPPMILESNGTLIHILDSDDPEHAIHIYSVDYGLCKVPLKLNFHQRYPRRATTLGNGKIVIWLLNYRLIHESTRVNLHEAKWRFVIVEPSSCKSAPSILAIKDSDLDYKPVDVVDVVGYYDHFEVFVNPLMHNNQKHIYGYKYFDNGVPIRKDTGNNSVIPDSDLYSRYHPNTVRIHTVLKHNSTAGYFYLKIKSKQHETLIKRFNSIFQSTFNTTLQKSSDNNDQFDSYSINHGNITYCQHTRRHLHCSLLDNSLQSKINLTLDYERHVDYFSKIGRFSISNTADGSALLFVAIESNYRIGPPFFIQKINANGQISEPVYVGRIFCDIHHLNSYEMPNGTYCVCVVCDELVHTRCFRLNSHDGEDDNDYDDNNDL